MNSKRENPLWKNDRTCFELSSVVQCPITVEESNRRKKHVQELVWKSGIYVPNLHVAIPRQYEKQYWTTQAFLKFTTVSEEPQFFKFWKLNGHPLPGLLHCYCQQTGSSPPWSRTQSWHNSLVNPSDTTAQFLLTVHSTDTQSCPGPLPDGCYSSSPIG